MTEDAAAGEPLASARQPASDPDSRQPPARSADRHRIEPAYGDGLPAGQQQRYLWFLSQSMPDLPIYNMPVLLRLQGELDEPALRNAITRLAARHETLRTRFRSEGGVPCQVIDPPRPVPYPVVDLRLVPPASRLRQATRLAEQEVRRTFDLHDGPLMRFWLARLANDDHILLLNCHQIISDGWSLGILIRELATLYVGRDEALPKLELQPVDHALRQQQSGADLERDHLTYWRTRLAGVPTLDLPTDRPAAQQRSRHGAVYERPLAPDLIDRARRLAAEESASSVLAVLLAAFYTVLFRYTGETDLAIGSVFSGRTRPELENLVGCFANTVVLRVDLAGDPTGRELIRRCNSIVSDGLRHQDVPFGVLVEEFQPNRPLGRNPFFEICFTVTDDLAVDVSFGEVRVTALPAQQGTSRYDLSALVTLQADGGMSVRVEYSTALFDQDRIERLVRHFETVLASMTAEPDRRLSTQELLPAEESHLLLDSWNPQPVELDSAELLSHELVMASTVRFPDRVALRFDGVDVSYAELAEQANRLARLLQSEHRVGPERVVAVLLDRGIRIPVARLAVLQAGAAWLSLDPTDPAHRIELLLSDAAPALVITDRSLAGSLPPQMPRIVLDDPLFARRLAELDPTPPSCPTRPEDAACLIYSSGPAGPPQGVLVPHRAIVNFVEAAQALFAVTPDDRILRFADPSLDDSIFDGFLALAHGATSVDAPRAVLHDMSLLAELMRRERISIGSLPTAVLRLLDPDSLPGLRALFVRPEAFEAEPATRWRTAQRQVHIGYGRPEVTVACVDYPCPEERLVAPPPLGRPMLNQRAYVLDPSSNPAPIGVPGQLHIAGVGLARGYLGRPALTAERFVPCPFGEPGARMYATGDLAVWRADGQLQFVGRPDQWTTAEGEQDHARPSRPAGHQQPSQPRASETERVIAEIWQDLLQIEAETIDRSDSFFQLGGSSLVVMRLVSRLRMAFGVEVTASQVFQAPVLCELAREVDRLSTQQALDEAEVDARLAALSDEQVRQLLAEGIDILDGGAGAPSGGLSSGGSG